MSIHRFIAIEGNIGAGKTTLARRLSELWSTQLILEQFEDNPFLPLFYEDPRRHAFPLEMYFLAERYRQLSEEMNGPDLFGSTVVSDYYLEKSLIFARNNLDENEFSLFRRLYDIMFKTLPKPDLIVFLIVPTSKLKSHIEKRGRIYEQSIKEEYLQGIQQVYLEHLATLQGLRILLLDYGELDFATKKEDLFRISETINQEYPVGITRISL